ncbi:MAG TPA: UvrD-helicase domain-containing protein [Tepidisphaeraceae bacterium]|nr:UvrD-helicase domain-containing protein [Tepidisphaeraceae bacterium]
MQIKELLEDLTEPQRAAVQHVDGPLLIVAGAGSGKTRVITRRVAYLIAQGIPAASILAITFTNKAAGEMKARVGTVLDRPLRDFGRLDQHWPTICTFHSLCLRILRHYAPQIGLPTNFTIYDSGDQTKLVKDALKSLDISSTNFAPGAVHAAISNAKNQLQSAEAFAQSAPDFYARTVARVYTKYQQLLAANNALDFDDLLLKTAHAFRNHPQVLRELQDRFQYILIDEYQDTNHAQYVIAHALALHHRNLCVVGDPDQSIYAWRGADIKNILEFERDYPDAHVVKLEQNYRSTRTILAVASKLIANNAQRKDKSLWTENKQGEKAKLFLCQDEHDEAHIVMQSLKEAQEAGTSWSDMAIFYRMNSLSRVMEDALRRANVPYVMARGVEFYNRKVIKDVLAYLRVIANPADEVSLTRIVNVPPRGIGDSSIRLMQTRAIAGGTTLWAAMERAASIPELSSRAVNSTKAFVELANSWRAMALPPSPTDSGERAFESAPSTVPPQRCPLVRLMEDVVRRSGLEATLKKAAKITGSDDEGNDPLANVNELISSVAEFENENPEGTLNDYLAQVSLVSDADHMKGNGGAVTLMTLHAAKGLEFPLVAMIGLEEGILPHSRARESVNQLEEERRLCFVGITRVQQKLILTKAAYRTIRGLRERTITSPFLNEMPQDALEVVDRTGLAFADTRTEYRERLETESDRLAGQFRKGQLVRHPTFGLGRIAEVSDMGQHTRAIIEFNAAGRKTLILQYARLEPVA